MAKKKLKESDSLNSKTKRQPWLSIVSENSRETVIQHQVDLDHLDMATATADKLLPVVKRPWAQTQDLVLP